MGRAKLTRHAEVAQLVEHHLAMVRVAGSNPVFRSGRGCGAKRRRWRHGRVVRQGSAKPCTPVRFRVPPLGSAKNVRAISSGGERFLDAEEVSGSNPLSPTLEIPAKPNKTGAPGF